MAAVYFETSNDENKLTSPSQRGGDIPSTLHFGNAKTYSGYLRLIVESSVIADRVDLFTCGYQFSNGVATHTLQCFLNTNGRVNIQVWENGSRRQWIETIETVPADVVTEIAFCIDYPNNNNYQIASVFINGVASTFNNWGGNRAYPLSYNSEIILGGTYDLYDGASGLLITDFILTDARNHMATPITSAPAGTHVTVWRSDFNDSGDPYKITVERNGENAEYTWTEHSASGIVWTDAVEIPSSGGGDTGGIIIPGNGNITQLQGIIKEDDQPVARRVFAITQALLEVAGSTDTKHAVLSSTLSDPINGSYSLDTSPYESNVIIVALDDDGSVWQADTAYAIGDVIRPPTFQGYVYHCTQAGTSDSTEPTWWFDTEQSYAIGTAQFKAKPYNRPLAHGPIIPEIIPEN